jgi:hypothetical protein
MSLLVAIPLLWPVMVMWWLPIWEELWTNGIGRLQLEMTLNELAELFAVFVAHVDEFDAAAVRPDVADHGGEIDFAETGADFELDRIAYGELPRGF